MAKMILPHHTAQAVKADRRRAMEASTADTIQASTINQLASDDFITPAQVQEQLDELREYVEERRKVEANYALPTPLGWRITVLMMTIPEVTAGGLHLVDDQREARAVASPQGVVLALGDSAFQDPARFDGEPWLRVGDRVVWKRYDVMMFQLPTGQRIGFMNDTQAVGLIDRGWNVI